MILLERLREYEEVHDEHRPVEEDCARCIELEDEAVSDGVVDEDVVHEYGVYCVCDDVLHHDHDADVEVVHERVQEAQEQHDEHRLAVPSFEKVVLLELVVPEKEQDYQPDPVRHDQPQDRHQLLPQRLHLRTLFAHRLHLSVLHQERVASTNVHARVYFDVRREEHPPVQREEQVQQLVHRLHQQRFVLFITITITIIIAHFTYAVQRIRHHRSSF